MRCRSRRSSGSRTGCRASSRTRTRERSTRAAAGSTPRTASAAARPSRTITTSKATKAGRATTFRTSSPGPPCGSCHSASGSDGLNDGWLSWVLGDWQLNWMLLARSGQPFNVTADGDPANVGFTGYSRANVVGDPNENAGTVDRWINPAAFAIPVNSLRQLRAQQPSGARLLECGSRAAEELPVRRPDAAVPRRSVQRLQPHQLGEPRGQRERADDARQDHVDERATAADPVRGGCCSRCCGGPCGERPTPSGTPADVGPLANGTYTSGTAACARQGRSRTAPTTSRCPPRRSSVGQPGLVVINSSPVLRQQCGVFDLGARDARVPGEGLTRLDLLLAGRVRDPLA